MPQWRLPLISQYVSRVSHAWLAAAALALCSALTPAAAQAQSAPPAAGTPTKPATRQDVAIYSQMGAFSSCSLAIDQKIPLQKTIGSNINMVAFVIRELHGSIIADVGSGKLSDTQLTNGAAADVIVRIKNLCYTNLATADKKFIDDNIAQIQKQIQSMPRK